MINFRIRLLCKILLCVLSGFFAFGCKKSGEGLSGQLNEMKRYPYERLHLTYEYSGDVRGIEELFVSGYGKYEARRSKLEILSTKEIRPSDNGAITRSADMYTMDFSKMQAVHEHLRFLDSLYHLEGKDIPSPQEYIESEMKKNYFKNVGKDTVAGKLATKWQQDGDRLILWISNGLMLRKHVNSENGSLDMVVKNIDTLWTVDTTKFIIPTGFTVIEQQR